MTSEKSISEILTLKRLGGYQGKNNNTLESQLHRYNYNISISQEFYPLLHILEISLRNSLHLCWGEILGDQNWLSNHEKHPFLQSRERKKIEDAIDDLRKRERAIEDGRIIAELNLAFWVNLYDRPYLNMHIKSIKAQFPKATNRQRDIYLIKEKLGEIRVLRNRIFHYEPIWHWNNLSDYANNIKSLLSWINEDLLLKTFSESEKKIFELIARQEILLK